MWRFICSFPQLMKMAVSCPTLIFQMNWIIKWKKKWQRDRDMAHILRSPYRNKYRKENWNRIKYFPLNRENFKIVPTPLGRFQVDRKLSIVVRLSNCFIFIHLPNNDPVLSDTPVSSMSKLKIPTMISLLFLLLFSSPRPSGRKRKRNSLKLPFLGAFELKKNVHPSI